MDDQPPIGNQLEADGDLSGDVLGPVAERAKSSAQFAKGWPDGMAVGQGGDMWVALTGAGRLDRVGPTGQILDSAALPSGALPTTVCFSGERADEPYVTTSFHQVLVRIRL